MDWKRLERTALFSGIDAGEIERILTCLGAGVKSYRKGEAVYRAGDRVKALGMVLSGGVHIVNEDVWGNTAILDDIGQGEIFAETYACLPQEALMVTVLAAEDTDILFLYAGRLLDTCSNPCEAHGRLLHNLLMTTAHKNLILSRKIFHTSPKTIRGRVLSYLSFMAVDCGKRRFEIPFNRQQLADYLGVDRSALSNELSKMQRDGLISYKKNAFCLLTDRWEENLS